MNSTANDRLAAVAPNNPPTMSLSHTATDRHTETSPVASSGDQHHVGSLPVATDYEKASLSQQHNMLVSTDERFSQSDPRSAEGSQASNATSGLDRVFTPTPSDENTFPNHQAGPSQDSQLLQLSALAAARDRMATDDEYGPYSRKRMADGEVKSPGKGHSRNTSTISMASTTSTIGDLSYDLKTRLSYAMVKVNNGWQSHSLDEVESLASQAVSPTSSTSTTVHRRNGSSASPQMRDRPLSQVHFASEKLQQSRRKSNSPPTLSNRPTLAPPATIRPSMGVGASSPHPRRNSNPNYTPTLLSHSHSASPRTPAQPPRLDTTYSKPQVTADTALYPPHQHVREQDAAESLLFMSSPNNSANMKHTFSPSGSPGPSSQPAPRSSARQPLPGGPRKALPTGRPDTKKKVGFGPSPNVTPVPESPMELDSPHQMYGTPHRGTPRRRIDGSSGHMRSALSLPSALGISHVTHRQPISDRDIDKMLDRRDEGHDSSDDEDIELPQRRNGMPGAIRA